MKNKRLLAVLAVLAVLVGGSLIYSSPNKDGKANPTTDKKQSKSESYSMSAILHWI